MPRTNASILQKPRVARRKVVRDLTIREEHQRGMSVIEVAIILIIIGISAAGVVQGQQLVASARTRAVITQQEKFTLALLAFQDRFRALPGDYQTANISIPGVVWNGNGNGIIESNATPFNSNGVRPENILAWDHISKAGFVNERYEFTSPNLVQAVPTNIYGGFANIEYDTAYGNPVNANKPSRHSVKSGNLIPVEILWEMDNKVDDGRAFSGVVQFSNYATVGPVPTSPGGNAGCTDANGNWQINAIPRQLNCGVASFF